WKLTSSNPSTAATSVTAQPVSVPQQSEVQIPQQSEVPPPVVNQTNTVEPANSVTADTSANSAMPESVTHDKNTKPVALNAVQDKSKKPASPAPAKAPAPKKSVTVDDLINDH